MVITIIFLDWNSKMLTLKKSHFNSIILRVLMHLKKNRALIGYLRICNRGSLSTSLTVDELKHDLTWITESLFSRKVVIEIVLQKSSLQQSIIILYRLSLGSIVDSYNHESQNQTKSSYTSWSNVRTLSGPVYYV